MKKVFITGATGFIGSNLACKLANQGNEVHAIIRSTLNVNPIGHKNIKLFKGNLLDLKTINTAIKGCSQVYHLAAYAKNWAPDRMLFYKTNVEGTNNILKAACEHSIQKIVCTSTSLVFGPSNGRDVDESGKHNTKPYTEYDKSKIIEEEIIQQYVAKGSDVVTVYPTRVFGPGLLNESNSVTLMILQYLKGSWRFKLSNGNAIGNYSFVDDVVNGHINAMQQGKKGAKYIIGGENISYNNFFNEIDKFLGTRRMMINIPANIAHLYSKIEEGLANRFNKYPVITPGWVKMFLDNWAFSSDKAISEINYNITPFQIALEKTIDWIRERRIIINE